VLAYLHDDALTAGLFLPKAPSGEAAAEGGQDGDDAEDGE